jgi:hypothetical protein
MTLKPTPRPATWFLKQFGSNTEDESVMGDLSEQYQRGRSSIWYWRQVLSIVFVGLFREARRNKWNFLVGFFRTWCVWGGLQVSAGVVLLAGYAWLHPEQLQNRISVNGFPLLTLRAMATSSYGEQVERFLLTMLLNVMTLFLVGRYCASCSRIQPRTMLLAFITTYAVLDAGSMVTNLFTLAQHQQINLALAVIRDLIALPLTAATILYGGRRGLSSASQLKRG